MKDQIPLTLAAREIGTRWQYHPSSVIRVMKRFGISGLKFGSAKQSARRFSLEDVRKVEELAGLTPKTTYLTE